MDKALLRSVMVLHGDTNKTLAEYLEISERSLSAKINENNSQFVQREIVAIKNRYNLSDDMVVRIFLN